MPGSEPRKHHIVSRFYLAGFASPEKPNRLLAFDHKRGKSYSTSPSNACKETDFYRVEEPGVDPNEIEKLMAWHEGVVSGPVGDVGAGQVTHKRQVGEVLSFAALLAVRDRRARQQLQNMLRERIGMMLRRGEVTRAQWEQLRASELRNGATPDQVPEYDEARERLIKGDWFPRAPVAPVVGVIPEAQEVLMKLLHQRNWELHLTDSTEHGGFITSDSPLCWGDLNEALAGRSQDLANPDVEITFPVSRNAALVSYLSARNSTCEATREIVGHVNSRALHFSTRVVLYGHDDFLLLPPDGRLRKGSEAIEAIRDARRRGIRLPGE